MLVFSPFLTRRMSRCGFEIFFLFSMKNKKNVISLLYVEFVERVVKVNENMNNFDMCAHNC